MNKARWFELWQSHGGTGISTAECNLVLSLRHIVEIYSFHTVRLPVLSLPSPFFWTRRMENSLASFLGSVAQLYIRQIRCRAKIKRNLHRQKTTVMTYISTDTENIPDAHALIFTHSTKDGMICCHFYKKTELPGVYSVVHNVHWVPRQQTDDSGRMFIDWVRRALGFGTEC